MRKMRRNALPNIPASGPVVEALPEAPPLDREQVVQAALALLNEVGIDGLTMRRLAERLGIKAASLYWHVRNKEELLDLLAEAICGTVRDVSLDRPWQERLVAMAHESRRALLAHRDAAQILAGTVPTGANRLRLVENALSTLQAAGFGPQDVVYAGFLVNDYVTEFVLEESRFISALRTSADQTAQAFEQVGNYFANLPSQLYPTIVALHRQMVEINQDERFQFGIDVLLAGLEQRLLKNKP